MPQFLNYTSYTAEAGINKLLERSIEIIWIGTWRDKKLKNGNITEHLRALKNINKYNVHKSVIPQKVQSGQNM